MDEGTILVYCCPSTVPSLWPPSPLPNVQYIVYRQCVTGGGGCWNVLWTIFCRSFTLCFWPDSEPTKLFHHPKMTSKDNIEGCNITVRRDEINGMRYKVLCSCESRLWEDYCTVWRITPGRALQYGGPLMGEQYSMENHSCESTTVWRTTPGRALQYGGPFLGRHYNMEEHSWEITTVWRPTPGRALQ